MSVIQEVGELGCTIKQVKIPHSLASSLFFAYSVQDTKGQTPAFHADGILKLLNFSITIPYTRRETTEIQFSLLGRAPWGKALRIGTCAVEIPDAVSDGAAHAVDFTIQSEVGPFTVDLLFQLLERDEDFVPEMHSLLAGTSPMILYEDLLSKDKPDITDAVRDQIYSPDSGIGARLVALAKHKPTNDDVQTLERLLGPFQRDAARAREESRIWRDAIMGLFRPSPESIDMVSGGRRKSNQVCDAAAPTMPEVAVVLLSHAEAILNGGIETSDDHFDNEVIDVSQLIHLLAGRTKVSEHKMLYMLSVSYFVAQYLSQRGRGRFDTGLKMMENAFRTMATSIAESYVEVFSGRADNPSILRGDCDAKQTTFANFGFPPDLWVMFRAFILPILDHKLAAKWVASDLIVPPDINSYQTRCTFDGFQWPLLAGVCQIAKDAAAIIAKKKKFDAYRPELTGAWMNRILRKMKSDAKTGKIIDKLMTGRNHEPGMIDISDVYAWIDDSFGGEHFGDRKLAWRIPDRLPPLNKPT